MPILMHDPIVPPTLMCDTFACWPFCMIPMYADLYAWLLYAEPYARSHYKLNLMHAPIKLYGGVGWGVLWIKNSLGPTVSIKIIKDHTHYTIHTQTPVLYPLYVDPYAWFYCILIPLYPNPCALPHYTLTYMHDDPIVCWPLCMISF